MAEAQYAPNHTVDPNTGYLESNAYLTAFNGERKTLFIRLLIENGLDLYTTCDQMSLSTHTVNKHYRNDPAFKDDLDIAKREYAERLDGVSKRNAMNPKSVIERIFQLKYLYPEKYADQKTSGTVNISLNIDGKSLEMIKKRDEIIEADVITGTLDLATGSTKLSAKNETENG